MDFCVNNGMRQTAIQSPCYTVWHDYSESWSTPEVESTCSVHCRSYEHWKCWTATAQCILYNVQPTVERSIPWNLKFEKNFDFDESFDSNDSRWCKQVCELSISDSEFKRIELRRISLKEFWNLRDLDFEGLQCFIPNFGIQSLKLQHWRLQHIRCAYMQCICTEKPFGADRTDPVWMIYLKCKLNQFYSIQSKLFELNNLVGALKNCWTFPTNAAVLFAPRSNPVAASSSSHRSPLDH